MGPLWLPEEWEVGGSGALYLGSFHSHLSVAHQGTHTENKRTHYWTGTLDPHILGACGMFVRLENRMVHGTG